MYLARFTLNDLYEWVFSSTTTTKNMKKCVNSIAIKWNLWVYWKSYQVMYNPFPNVSHYRLKLSRIQVDIGRWIFTLRNIIIFKIILGVNAKKYVPTLLRIRNWNLTNRIIVFYYNKSIYWICLCVYAIYVRIYYVLVVF